MAGRLTLTGVWVALGLAACSTAPRPDAARPARFDVVVIGDTPYTAADREMVARAIPATLAVAPPFVLHVGDYQSGAEVCGEHDARFQSLLAALAPLPVIYTPGDNEWTDCDRKTDPATGRPFSELDRLELLRRMHFSRDVAVPPGMTYARSRKLPENAWLDHAGVTVVTVNVSATNNGRDAVMGDDLERAARAADFRDKANVRWLKAVFERAKRRRAQAVIVVMQADMTVPGDAPPCGDAIATSDGRRCDGFSVVREALVEQARLFGRPVLLVHGDTDPFSLTRGDLGADNLWRLNAAGDAGIDGATKEPYGVVDVTRLTIDLSDAIPFRASGLLTGTQLD